MFFGTSISIEAQVLLPASYGNNPQRAFPVLYWIPAFDEPDGARIEFDGAMRAAGQEFVVVSLQSMFRGIDPVFADSVNSGPWATALTTEFIPQFENRYHIVQSPSARFLAGHSSGGWAALWLQVTHSQFFGGVWSLSPDPVDFRDFTGPNLALGTPGNMYHDDGGAEYTSYRVHGHDTKTLHTLANAPDWGYRQFFSFDEVFGPRDAQGNAMPLFDRVTGVIDPSVAAYWESHYDISRIVRDNWSVLKSTLHGKLHVYVGTEDTFHLDRAVRLFDRELRDLGSDADIEYVPGADHWTVYNYHGGMASVITSGIVYALRSGGRE